MTVLRTKRPSFKIGEEEEHIRKKFKKSENNKQSTATVISWNGEGTSNNAVDDESFRSVSTKLTNTTTPSTDIIPLTDDEEECVSFLMTLKFRQKNVQDDVRKIITEGLLHCPVEETKESESFTNSPFSAANEKSKKMLNPVPLGLEEDLKILSPLQCYIRSQCVEVFEATMEDCVQQSSRSRSKISIGRVGIRCAFCQSSSTINTTRRTCQSVSFPTQISGLYSAVSMMQSRHFKNCTEIPKDVFKKFDELKNIRKGKGEGKNRQQHWIESAKKLGLVDTSDGIRHQRLSKEKTTSSSNLANNILRAKNSFLFNSSTTRNNTPNQVLIPRNIASSQVLQENMADFIGESELFAPQDADLVPSYLFLAMAQMKPCVLLPEDRVGCYKDREIGFKGMCCRHCGGSPGFGKYFPATLRSLAQTTTSQTIIKHISHKCTKCPDDLKILLERFQKEGLAQGGNYGRGGKNVTEGKPKYGSRKIFFERLWSRIHGLEVPPLPMEVKKEEEMSSLGDDSSVVDMDDEEHWEDQKFSRRK